MSTFNKWKKEKTYAERKSKFYGFLFRTAILLGIIVAIYVNFIEKHVPIQKVPFIGDSWVASFFSSYKQFEEPEVNATVEVVVPPVEVKADMNVTTQASMSAVPPVVTPVGQPVSEEAMNKAMLVIVIYDNNKSTVTYNQGNCSLNSACNDYLQTVLKNQQLIK